MKGTARIHAAFLHANTHYRSVQEVQTTDQEPQAATPAMKSGVVMDVEKSVLNLCITYRGMYNYAQI